MNKLNKLSTIALILASSQAIANEVPNADKSWLQLEQEFYAATEGKQNPTDVRKAMQTYIERQPNDFVAGVYLGSTYCLEGRDALAPWTKWNKVKQCLELMDEALINVEEHHQAQSSSTLKALVTYGLTTASLPTFFDVSHAAYTALSDVQSHPLFGQMDASSQQMVKEAYQFVASR